MNNTRRKELMKIQDELHAIQSKLEDLLNEEQEYFDNMPEGLQSGQKGETAQDAIDKMETAINEIENIRDGFAELT